MYFLNYLFWAILYPLICTIVIECGLALVITKNFRFTYCVLLCNMLTNPLLNLVLIILSTTILKAENPLFYCITGILEITVIITEAWLLIKMQNLSIKKAIAISFVLNISSVGIGFFLQNAGIVGYS